MLDWGCGCGWFLSWAALYFGVRGLGIDSLAANVEYARQHSIGTFCVGGTDLSHIRAGSLDFVVSYWSFYHLASAEKQCSLAGDLVSKLRVGGRAWFGGNMPSASLNIVFNPMDISAWEGCFERLAVTRWRSQNFTAEIEMVEDAALFRDRSEDAIHPGDYLFWPGTFSVLFMRLS